MVGSIPACSSRAHKALLTAAAGITAVLLAGCSGGGHTSADRSGASTAPTSRSSAGATSASATGATANPVGPVATAGGAHASAGSSHDPSAKGGKREEVPSRTMTTAAPVGLHSTATFGGRVTARITAIKAIRATGHGPGEISGPALEVTFALTNASAASVPLDSVTATLTDSSGTPAVSMIGSPAKPFKGTAPAGKSVRAVYVFSVAADRRSSVTVSLNYSAGKPVVLFVGNAS